MIYNELKKVKCVVLDVDGVLTNGNILVTDKGEQLRTFNVKDGYAMQYAVKRGLKVIIITGARSQGVAIRCQGLGASEVHLGISDKLTLLKEILEREQLDASQVMFIGDDMPDYACMKYVGVAVCPADAIEDIKAICQFVSKNKGGQGVVREMIEKTLRLQENWHVDVLTTSV